jgi:hypothetical protein
MKLSDLKAHELIYVGTPYSKFRGGIEAAFAAACNLMGGFVMQGLKVYSPIAHTHPIAIYCGLDPFDHSLWLPFDQAIMAKSDAMIVAEMDGWADSYGVKHEIEVFRSAYKPVYFVNPKSMEVRT